ncbi:hypothetical protein Agabi119p4_9894 [Agaricus bisporus var. burnettii]|uniref:DUF7330 domain-containing protein n=1 Tax=Agaricus bisporus var. burnettii TaxID=192524 RepID=A0A8H7C434_AGABI|nr:hypothetical protein Agabi119p4_9894 [Agaricus bisporus var. burnettii]
MIILDDKRNEALEAQRLVEEQANQEPPPTYSSLQHSTLASEQSLRPSGSDNPTNFYSVCRGHDKVKETVTIDPNLYTPPSLLLPMSPDETEETRKHVRLESIHGSVNATVNIVPVLRGEKCKIRMFMRSSHGGVFARINGPESRHPFQLVAHSTYGSVTLRLPRSFEGPIMISLRYGSVKFSDEINKHLTTFGEANHVRHCFVGDLSRWHAGSDVDWGGDEIVVEAKYGGVKIQYDDDAPGSVVRVRPSLLNRVFGF